MKITVEFSVPANFGKRTPEIVVNLFDAMLIDALANKQKLGPKKVYGVLEERRIIETHKKLIALLRAMKRSVQII